MTRQKEIKAHEDDLTVSEEVYKLARQRADQELATMEERQGLIAKVHEVIGQIKATAMMSKFGDVTSLMWLKEVKDSKIYKDVPNVGTWEKFCESVGKDRSTVDQDLLNLATFGEEFLGMVTSLRVGYKDLRKLRQLTHDGSITVDAEAIVIAGERIPLDADHKDDLQTAIEAIIEEQTRIKEDAEALLSAKDKVLKSKADVINKMERELKRFEKDAAAKGLTPDEDAYIQQINNLKTGFDGYLLRLENYTTPDEYEPLNPLKKAALISATHYMKMRILALHDTVTMEFGNPVTNPEILEEFEAWERDQAQIEPQKK